MKGTDLKPCIRCDGKLLDADNGIISFSVLRCSTAAIDFQAARATLGLEMMFGGHGRLAEVMSPDPDVVKEMSELDENFQPTELHICMRCSAELGIGELEARQAEKEGSIPRRGET